MAKKASSFDRLCENAQALLDEHFVHSAAELPRFHRFAHFWVMVVKSFIRNRCPVRASALAYATVLALIPMLAVAVGITSSFLKNEGEEQIDHFIAKLVSSMAPVADTSSQDGNSPAAPQEEPSQTSPGATASTLDTTNSLDGQTNSSGSTNDVSGEVAKRQQAVWARRATAHYIHQFIKNTRSGTLGVTGSGTAHLRGDFHAQPH